jgi:hypothetical protein
MCKRAPASFRLTNAAYKKFVTIIISIFVVIFGCCFALYTLVSLPCGNNVIDEFYSPDHQHKVVVFQSGCGVNSTDFMNAAILNATWKLSNSNIDFFRVNILKSDVRNIGEIRAAWIDNRSIQITYSYSNKILVQKREFNYFNQIFTVYYEEKEK